MSQPVFLITGGGGGIGSATACLAAEAGFALVLAGRRKETLEDVRRGLPTTTQILTVACDVAEWSQMRDLVAAAESTFGRLDVAFANAGVSPDTSFLGTNGAEPQEWREAVLTNVLGPALTAPRSAARPRPRWRAPCPHRVGGGPWGADRQFVLSHQMGSYCAQPVDQSRVRGQRGPGNSHSAWPGQYRAQHGEGRATARSQAGAVGHRASRPVRSRRATSRGCQRDRYPACGRRPVSVAVAEC